MPTQVQPNTLPAEELPEAWRDGLGKPPGVCHMYLFINVIRRGFDGECNFSDVFPELRVTQGAKYSGVVLVVDREREMVATKCAGFDADVECGKAEVVEGAACESEVAEIAVRKLLECL